MLNFLATRKRIDLKMSQDVGLESQLEMLEMFESQGEATVKLFLSLAD